MTPDKSATTTTTTSDVDLRTFFEASRPSRSERVARGASVRDGVPLPELAQLPSADERTGAVAILSDQETSRLPSLISLRRERMTTDPFAFLRGAAAVMAADLAARPNSGITVQLCGDAHVANFGMFASPERRLVFDLNDFDETLPGPFEWDVKRLAASVVVTAQANGHTPREARRAARSAARTYRRALAELANAPTLDVWFAHLDYETPLAALKKTPLHKTAVKAGAKAGRRTGDSAVAKLTEVVDGTRRFRSEPPLLTTIHTDDRDRVIEDLAVIYADYLATLAPDRLALLTRYSFVDVAHKVVGVGSVGTRAVVLLLESGDGEPLILQLKQAGPSVLEAHLPASRFDQSGKRVVVGQRVMQAAGDPFLGWCTADRGGPIDFYVRQLRDQKGSIETTGLSPDPLRNYASVCGGVLARAHARGGDASVITGYLGSDDTFDDAVTEWALGYAPINRRDFESLAGASA